MYELLEQAGLMQDFIFILNHFLPRLLVTYYVKKGHGCTAVQTCVQDIFKVCIS